jgi:hypothetical protein
VLLVAIVVSGDKPPLLIIDSFRIHCCGSHQIVLKVTPWVM